MRKVSGLRILKIGGSVITRKEGYEEINEQAIEEVCSTIAENHHNLILIHGAGSFGHPHVKKFGLKDAISIAKIHNACVRLNELFCRKLIEFGVPAVGMHPMSSSYELIPKMLERNLVPVLHGDVTSEFRVVSGDEIAVNIANVFGADRLGFATNVDGVFVNGKVVGKFTKEMTADSIGESDATGRMRGKLQKIFSLRTKCRVFIFKGEREKIKKFLFGEEVGTEVVL
ncbi:MAG: isopentenyl phosphate kinase [Archaeoglobaceae archaeon]